MRSALQSLPDVRNLVCAQGLKDLQRCSLPFPVPGLQRVHVEQTLGIGHTVKVVA